MTLYNHPDDCEDCECMNKHAQALGKLGGKVKSEAKAAASRKNGKLGGRPRKQQPAKTT